MKKVLNESESPQERRLVQVKTLAISTYRMVQTCCLKWK